MAFGENLKILRNSKGFSQKALADELGFSFQSISKWERGESLPDIATLLDIANFFETTADAILGHTTEKQFSTLQVDTSEVRLYRTYPTETVKIDANKGEMIFVADGDGRITATFSCALMRKYREGYRRIGYEPLCENSTLIFEQSRRGRNGLEIHSSAVKIPAGGFAFVMSESDFTSKRIVEFIVPEEYRVFLDPVTHEGYYDSRNGRYLFSDMLKHGELDSIRVGLSSDRLVFRKPAETVDPMSVNIETLAKIVRKELEKSCDRQIEDLKSRIEELTDQVDDNESRISELESRLSELEQAVTEMQGV